MGVNSPYGKLPIPTFPKQGKEKEKSPSKQVRRYGVNSPYGMLPIPAFPKSGKEKENSPDQVRSDGGKCKKDLRTAMLVKKYEDDDGMYEKRITRDSAISSNFGGGTLISQL